MTVRFEAAGRAGIGLGLAAAALFAAAVFTTYVRLGTAAGQGDLWHLVRNTSIAVLVLAAAAAAGSVLALALRRQELIVGVVALNAVNGGMALARAPLELSVRSWRDAYGLSLLLGLIALALAIAGGLLAYLGSRVVAAPEPQPETEPEPELEPEPEPVRAPPRRLAPVGWYPDPAGAAGERLWAGDHWTTETR